MSMYHAEFLVTPRDGKFFLEVLVNGKPYPPCQPIEFDTFAEATRALNDAVKMSIELGGKPADAGMQ